MPLPPPPPKCQRWCNYLGRPIVSSIRKVIALNHTFDIVFNSGFIRPWKIKIYSGWYHSGNFKKKKQKPMLHPRDSHSLSMEFMGPENLHMKEVPRWFRCIARLGTAGIEDSSWAETGSMRRKSEVEIKLSHKKTM